MVCVTRQVLVCLSCTCKLSSTRPLLQLLLWRACCSTGKTCSSRRNRATAMHTMAPRAQLKCFTWPICAGSACGYNAILQSNYSRSLPLVQGCRKHITQLARAHSVSNLRLMRSVRLCSNVPDAGVWSGSDCAIADWDSCVVLSNIKLPSSGARLAAEIS